MSTVKKEKAGHPIEMTPLETCPYPISVNEIVRRVARKNGRRGSLRKARDFQARLTLHDEESPNNVEEIVNEFGERIIRVDGDIPVGLTVRNRERYLFISHDQSALTHGLHKYPAKFFPELPRWLIRRYSTEGALILDPFSGSGTTSVEALLLRRNSVGIDVDPFSRFLAKVKVTPLEEDELRYCQEYLLQKVLGYHHSKVSDVDTLTEVTG